MKVDVLFIHPKTGLHSVTILETPSVEEVKEKLTELGCAVLYAEEVE